MEAEMRRMRLELRQTMDLYGTAYREALSAKQMVLLTIHLPIVQWNFNAGDSRKSKNQKILQMEKKVTVKGNFGAEEAARRIAMLEADKRLSAKMKSLKEESGMMVSAQSVVRYRKYTIDKDGNQWKERGARSVKFLKHKVSGKVWLVMRRYTKTATGLTMKTSHSVFFLQSGLTMQSLAM